MLVSPLLSADRVHRLSTLLSTSTSEETILDEFKDFSVEEQIHMLRFLYERADISRAYKDHLYRVWHFLLPPHHDLDTVENRNLLHEIQHWWDAFELREGMTTQQYDALEASLDALGATAEGKEYFKWVALSPVDLKQEGHVWDEDRRGAVICLGKYSHDQATELFLARHLDDTTVLQIEVVQILAARKSRLLARLAPWYLEHDIWLKPNLQEYF
ncbi:MAG TPA: hypothetical protein VKY19_18785 [Ktedonosporobacter sp.]|jgi:hypothetical protein|nr:hypothetical protein [Ktedonosporobacter sp.]